MMNPSAPRNEEEFIDGIRTLLALPDEQLIAIGGREQLVRLLVDQVAHTRALEREKNKGEVVRAMEAMYGEMPRTKFLQPALENVSRGAGMYENVRHILQTLGAHAVLANPFSEHLKANPDGTFNKTTIDIFAAYTDVRGFSKLSHEMQDDTVDCLQQNYYTFIARITQKFGMRVFSTAGDSLCIYCTDEVDDDGKIVKTKEEKGMSFSMELNRWTNIFAAIWKKFGVGMEEGPEGKKRIPLFETGIGVTTGRLFVKDVNDPVERTGGVVEDVHHAIAALMQNEYPQEQFKFNDIPILSLSQVVIRSARLEVLDPQFDQENIVMDHHIWKKLPGTFRNELIHLGVRDLKGVGDCKIYALPRNRVTDEQFETDIRPKLEAAGITVPHMNILLNPALQPVGGADGPADKSIL